MSKLEKLEKVIGKEMTDKLRAVFTIAQPEPTKFVKLADGSAELNGTIEVGSPITLVTPEGEVPAPNGEHAIEGGKTITVADGVITEIADTMVEAVEEEEEVMSAEKIEALIQSSLTTQASEFKKVTDAMAKTIAELKEGNKVAFQAVAESLELIAEMKASAPEPKADPKNVYAQKRAASFSKFLEIKEQIKTK
jgi:hypothetical protein